MQVYPYDKTEKDWEQKPAFILPHRKVRETKQGHEKVWKHFGPNMKTSAQQIGYNKHYTQRHDIAPGLTIGNPEEECKSQGFNSWPENPQTCIARKLVRLKEYELRQPFMQNPRSARCGVRKGVCIGELEVAVCYELADFNM